MLALIRLLRILLFISIPFLIAACNLNAATSDKAIIQQTVDVSTSTAIVPSPYPSPTDTMVPSIPTSTPSVSDDLTEYQTKEMVKNQPTEQGIQGWAVLVAKEDYTDTGHTNLDTDFLNLTQLRSLLVYSGWQADQILELRDDFGSDEIRKSLDWLEMVADQDDVVLFYIQGHSSFMREDLVWQSFFADEWQEILSNRRVLVVEACQAAEFTAATLNDPNPQLTVASVDSDELGWSGLWEEGMPIIGGVFSHYFMAAFTDPTADLDGDGFVSVQESTFVAERQQREYMHETIFTVPEFLAIYHAFGIYPERDQSSPSVILKDTIGSPVFLDLEAYQIEN